ncbi:MAG: ATP-binding cassette domain-containing protein [Planctomycetota bacterium]
MTSSAPESLSSVTENSSIRLQAVDVRIDERSILRRISTSVATGKITSLVGPSGCGKTTMLRVLAGLQPISGGKLSMPSLDMTRGEVGFVFQAPGLLRWLNALQNVTLPLDLCSRELPKSERLELGQQRLSEVQIADAADLMPRQLSGGMQMRASIARALVTEPKLLLLDEPFAALDDVLRRQLGQLVVTLCRQRQLTAIMVTHGIAEAIDLSDNVIVMRDGQIVDEIDVAKEKTSAGDAKSSAELHERIYLAMSGGHV